MKIFARNLLTFLGSVAVALSAQGQTPAPAAPPARLGSTVFQWDSFTAKPSGVGVRRDVTNLPTATLERFECHISTLNPGNMSHPPHKHPQEEFIILKEGLLEATINGVTARAGPGSILFCASNEEHGMVNVGPAMATYHVIRLVTEATPRPPVKT